MKKLFIELTQVDGNKFIANVTRIDRVIKIYKDGKYTTYISGLTNNGGFNVRETYEQVKDLINKALE